MLTRPTADRVREALFNIIQSRVGVEGARVLDICAGTGSLGIEALSRGAMSCCFIEENRNALSALRRNLSSTHLAERSDTLAVEVHKALRHLAARNTRFDLVFFDPPYDSGLYVTVPAALSDLFLIAPGGVLIAEGATRNVMPEQTGRLVKNDRRVYGDTALEFYIMEGE
jgi:16S rRNA (guanine(966)-N(2))-methyltransferase RsmD